jgi:hypothetical protein
MWLRTLHMGPHSSPAAAVCVQCVDQCAPLPWFLGMSVKANDHPLLNTTHTGSRTWLLLMLTTCELSATEE